MPFACPAVAAPTAPATVSPVMGPTDPCVPRMGTRMTTTVGANRLSAGNSKPSPPGTRARVVSALKSQLSVLAHHHMPSSSLGTHPPGLGPGWVPGRVGGRKGRDCERVSGHLGWVVRGGPAPGHASLACRSSSPSVHLSVLPGAVDCLSGQEWTQRNCHQPLQRQNLS